VIAVEGDGAGSPAPSDPRAQLAAGRIGRLTVNELLTANPGVALAGWLADDRAALTDHRRLRVVADRWISMIDEMIGRQLDTILAAPRFQALEAAWRGVAWLVDGLGVDGTAHIRLMDARWPEIVRDVERSTEVEQGALFDILYSQEFDMPGGVPFSLLLGLYAVQHRPSRTHPSDDVAVLRHLSQVAAAAFTPIILDAAPAFFAVDAMEELQRRQSLMNEFRRPDYARFRSLQATPDTRFLGLVAPRVRLRGSWAERAAGDVGFRYDADERAVLWGPGAFAIGHICLRAFTDHRWLGAIRGTVRDQLDGGIVAGLPTVDFATDAPGKFVKSPVEVHLPDGVDRELTELGIVTIRRVKGTPWLAIHDMPSLHKPERQLSTEAARANQRLGTMLNYILCVSRFAHYIKVIGREWIGSFQSAEECESRLQRWLNGFTAGGEDLDFETKARFPLQEGRISVSTVPGRPGDYRCTVALKPHFQLDQVISEFQLVTTIRDTEPA
jgi:type VI secretion system protein ImpD